MSCNSAAPDLKWWRRFKIPAYAGMTPFDVVPAKAETLQWRHEPSILACAGMTLLTIVISANACAFETRAHAKLQAGLANIPGDSLLQEFSDDPARDSGLDLRINLKNLYRYFDRAKEAFSA